MYNIKYTYIYTIKYTYMYNFTVRCFVPCTAIVGSILCYPYNRPIVNVVVVVVVVIVVVVVVVVVIIVVVVVVVAAAAGVEVRHTDIRIAPEKRDKFSVFSF